MPLVDLSVPVAPAHARPGREARGALRRRTPLLEPEGRFVFDVFAPSREDIAETHGRWLEREPGIFERADWDEQARTLTLSVRSGDVARELRAALARRTPSGVS